MRTPHSVIVALDGPVAASSSSAARLIDGLRGEGVQVVEISFDGEPPSAVLARAIDRIDLAARSIALIAGSAEVLGAGRGAGLGLVVGVGPDIGRSAEVVGADLVITDLDALPPVPSEWFGLLGAPKTALGSMAEIVAILAEEPAVFLDYDGTLTPIIDDPALATIDDGQRAILRRLAAEIPLGIVSGRGLDDVRALVAVDDIFYAGSHGFEILSPDGERFEHEAAVAVLPDLEEAQGVLEAAVADLDGVAIERKRFAIALHTRRAGSQQIRDEAGEVVRGVASRFNRLILTGGKEVHELRPNVKWDKGAALAHVLDVLPGSHTPVYVGDDLTDEDAFLEIRTSTGGVGVLVGPVESQARTWAGYVLADPDETFEFLSGLTAHYD